MWLVGHLVGHMYKREFCHKQLPGGTLGGSQQNIVNSLKSTLLKYNNNLYNENKMDGSNRTSSL